jgi:hypothetical protein
VSAESTDVTAENSVNVTGENSVNETVCTEQISSDDKDVGLKYKVSDFVNVEYRKKHYVGQIVKVDEEYQEYYINFMKKRKNGTYMFPKIRDELWMEPHQIMGLFTPE